MYNKLIFSTFLYIFLSTSNIAGMKPNKDCPIYSNCLFFTHSNSESALKIIQKNGVLKDTQSTDLKNFSLIFPCCLKLVNDNTYDVYINKNKEQFSLKILTSQLIIINNALENNHPAYVFVPQKYEDIYKINEIIPLKKIIDEKKLTKKKITSNPIQITIQPATSNEPDINTINTPQIDLLKLVQTNLIINTIEQKIQTIEQSSDDITDTKINNPIISITNKLPEETVQSTTIIESPHNTATNTEKKKEEIVVHISEEINITPKISELIQPNDLADTTAIQTTNNLAVSTNNQPDNIIQPVITTSQETKKFLSNELKNFFQDSYNSNGTFKKESKICFTTLPTDNAIKYLENYIPKHLISELDKDSAACIEEEAFISLIQFNSQGANVIGIPLKLNTKNYFLKTRNYSKVIMAVLLIENENNLPNHMQYITNERPLLVLVAKDLENNEIIQKIQERINKCNNYLLSNDSDTNTTINSQQFIKKLNEEDRQHVTHPNTKIEITTMLPKQPTPSTLSSWFTLKNGIVIGITGLMAYLIYTGRMTQYLQKFSLNYI